MTFVGQNISPPDGLQTSEFLLRPIVAADAELDYQAVMESKEFLRQWEQSTWPEDDFTVEANRKDMVKLEERHATGESFAYTMMNLEQTETLGCVYMFSPDTRWFAGGEIKPTGEDQWSDVDVMIYFWVRKSRLDEGLDRVLLDAVLSWFDQEWSFTSPVVVTTEEFEQQVDMLEASDLRRRFVVKLPDTSGASLAYA